MTNQISKLIMRLFLQMIKCSLDQSQITHKNMIIRFCSYLFILFIFCSTVAVITTKELKRKKENIKTFFYSTTLKLQY